MAGLAGAALAEKSTFDVVLKAIDPTKDPAIKVRATGLGLAEPGVADTPGKALTGRAEGDGEAWHAGGSRRDRELA